MPGRRVREIDTSLCRRCQTTEPAITIRNEPLCRSCLCKYVSTKIVKRMESFRVRNSGSGQERTLLLPLSFGPGSTALLDVLSQHLKGQVEKTGRTGFKLHVLYVEEASSADNDGYGIAFDQVKGRYPDHTYSTAALSDVLSSDNISGLDLPEMLSSSGGTGGTESMDMFLSSLNSATSRADAKQILMRRLIVSVAKEKNCEAVLWGDSTTRLAERVLAETAKGRGFSLPWIVADGESPHGIPFYYPMRDLLSNEIEAFASLSEPPFDSMIVKPTVKPAVSTKNTTIDHLMRQYFESVERDYPSIVANVVKTTGKLRPSTLSEVEKQCELCDMPLEGHAPERSRLCYGCIRILPITTDT